MPGDTDLYKADLHLLALAETAERGNWCPLIRVLTAGWLTVGRPVSTNAFLEANKTGLVNQQIVPKSRTSVEAQMADATRTAGLALDALRVAEPTDQQGHWLNLSQVSLHILGSTRLEIPAIRIAISSIAGWWLCQPKVISAEQDGGTSMGVGVGVVVPFDW